MFVVGPPPARSNGHNPRATGVKIELIDQIDRVEMVGGVRQGLQIIVQGWFYVVWYRLLVFLYRI